MGGAVFGMLAAIAVLFVSKRMGLRRPERDVVLKVAALCFLATLFFELVAIGGADNDIVAIGMLCAIGGWALLLHVVFLLMQAGDAARAD